MNNSYYLPSWGGVVLLLLLLLGGAVFGIALQLLVGNALGDWMTLVTYVVMFIPPLLYSSSVSGRNAIVQDGLKLNSSNFGRKGWPLYAVLALLGCVAAGFVSDALSLPLPPMPESLQRALEMMVGGNFLVSFLCVSICAPLFEEWLCRGMVLRGLLGNGVKPAWAILFSAFFFALIHFNPWQAIPAFIIGCMMGIVYFRTGSLLLTMLMHFVNNTLSLVMSRVAGVDAMDSWLDVLGLRWYVIAVSVAVVVVALCIRAFRRIPLKDAQGNMDVAHCLFR